MAASAAANGAPSLQGPPLAVFGLARAALAAAGLLLAARLVQQFPRSLGLIACEARRDALIGAAAGTAWALAELFILIPPKGGAARSDVAASLALTGGSVPGVLAVIVLGWTAGTFSEELFFRGFLIRLLRGLLGPARWTLAAAAGVSILWFAFAHRYQGWIGVVDVGMTGALFTALYLWRQRLTAPIAAHGLFNTVTIAGLYVLYG